MQSKRKKTFRPVKSVALITSTAHSLLNFRGPLIRAIIEQGIHVYALAPNYDQKTRKAIISLGAEPVEISMDRAGIRPLRDLIDLTRLYFLLRKLKPDVTFGYFIKPVIFGSMAAKWAGVPFRYAMVAGLGYLFTLSVGGRSLKIKGLQKLVLYLYKNAFKVCHTVFLQNADDEKFFIQNSVLKSGKIKRVNGTGVELDYFTVAAPIVSPVTFLLMARLLREKGIYEYIDAARKIKSKYPHICFLLLGNCDANPGSLTETEVKGWAEEGVIEWPGHIDDVRPWIAQSSVYVLPSYREGVPRSTQEAMAMGRPVITTDAVGCRDTVEEGVNGYLVPVRDSAALAKAMLHFIDNPALITSMGRESRRLAEERFNVHKINAIMLETMGISPS